MSVPKYRRSENKLQAIIDTVNMSKYAIQMCENEKIFPKKTRWTLCNRIIDECINAVCSVRAANKIKVVDEETLAKRSDLQFDALLSFETLCGILTIAHDLYSIPVDKIEHMSALLLQAEEMVAAWRRADKAKFNKK